jgi:phosphatidate cytidylyltransferase
MLSVFMIVWLADVCAYFAGRAFGKRKMAPAISPKKTWAGAVGAVVCVFGAALAARAFLPADVVYTSILFDRIGLVGAFVVVFLLVAVSIAGDLFESALKRQADIKDSSNLLPGHGGFFDRLDAALAVLPVAVATLVWF